MERYIFPAVIALVFAVLLIALVVQSKRLSKLHAQIASWESANCRLRKEKEKLVSDAETLNEQLSRFIDLERKETEIKELIEQEKALARLCNPSASQAKLTYLSSFDELGIQYGYSLDGNELRRAVQNVQALYYSGECVRSTTSAPLEPGASACLLDTLNGFASGQIEKAKSGKYDLAEIVQQIKDSFLIANIRGRSAMHAEITKEYLDAILKAVHWADAVLKLKQAERDEQRYLDERRKEEARATAEIERKIEEAKRIDENLQWEYTKAVRAYEKNPSDKNKQRVAELKEKCKEASIRVQSLAEMLRRGTVYILSNIGSFGENIYKIGMSRRLNPKDRVDELSSASVPFPFDIHALIPTDNAPELETKLHSIFFDRRVNVASMHKEFFRVTIEEIRAACDDLGLRPEWTMIARAEQYIESLRLQNSPLYHEMLNRHQEDQVVFDELSEYQNEQTVPQKTETDILIDSIKSGSERCYSIDAYVTLLQKSNIKYLDKRSMGGCLWIYDCEQAKPFVEGVQIDGVKPAYVKKSKSLDGSAGWYIK